MARLLTLCSAFLCLASLTQALPTAVEKRAVSQDLFNDLVHYARYASNTYLAPGACTRPNGNEFVQDVYNRLTDTEAYVARDDSKKEIIVAFRGSESLTDWIIDAKVLLLPWLSSTVRPPVGTLVHAGFLTSWKSVEAEVLSIVKGQLTQHPGYTIVSTGHSLGGAVSTLAGIALRQNFPSTAVKLYSYGSPRVGNSVFAQFIENKFGRNAIRATHTTDGVPTIIPHGVLGIGYYHHGVEVWQFSDPATPANVKECNGGEDRMCSGKYLSGGINEEHHTYFGIGMGDVPFCS